MPTRTNKLLSAASLWVLFCSGCVAAGNHAGLAAYPTQSATDGTYSFRQIVAVEDAGQWKVSGKIRNAAPIHTFMPKTVEVTLLDPSGNPIESRNVVSTPRTLPGHKHHREERFSATFDEAPPAGTTIRLAITE